MNAFSSRTSLLLGSSSLLQAPYMLGSNHAAPPGPLLQPTHHHLQSTPLPTLIHSPQRHHHSSQLPSDPKPAQRAPNSWNCPHPPAPAARQSNTGITHLQTQSTAGPSRNAASQHPGMISLDALSGFEQARLPPTSGMSNDLEVRSQYHSWASSNSSSPVLDSHLNSCEYLWMPQSASASSALAVFPLDAGRQEPSLAQVMAASFPSNNSIYGSNVCCKQETSLVHWVQPQPLTGSPLASGRTVKRDSVPLPQQNAHTSHDNHNNSAIPSAWLVAQPVCADPFTLIPRPETPATPSIGRIAPGTYRISPHAVPGPPSAQPSNAGFRPVVQSQMLVGHESRSSFTSGAPLVVPQAGIRPSFMFGGPPGGGVSFGLPDRQLPDSLSHPCQLREVGGSGFVVAAVASNSVCCLKLSVKGKL